MPYDKTPFKVFDKLYREYLEKHAHEPSAAVLATATPDGVPSARVVLVKEYDQKGFVFYTNLESRKAQELKINPKAALCFYWEAIFYQVRVSGRVEMVSDAEADAYFASRPRGSQIGAWASKQSRPMTSRDELEGRVVTYEKKFEGSEVPRPAFWSGFRVIPERYEFWQRRENRLHERVVYIKNKNNWDVSLVYP